MVNSIRQNLQATGTNATGSTARSLRFEVKTEGAVQTLRVLGRPYFMTVETGRKPTPDYKPSYEFVASIRQWMAAKGKEGNPYAVALNIHKKGTELYRKGGRQDIVSNVIGQDFIARITKDILAQFAQGYLNKTVSIFNNGRSVN